jgi:hypothetical protein
MVILKEIKLYHEFRFEDFISLYMSSIEICISKIMITKLTYRVKIWNYGLDITFPCLRFNIDSKLFGFKSNSLNRSYRVQNLVSNKTGFVIFGISYNSLLNLQVKNITHMK